MSDRVALAAGSVLVGATAAVVILALAIAPFVNPVWVAFAQDRAGAAALAGFTQHEVRVATDAILADLVFGPPAFAVEVAGTPVLSEAERSHMRDVRDVLGTGALVAVIAAALLVAARLATPDVQGWWAAVRGGAIGLALAVLAVGAIAVVAFQVAFEVFHRIFFSQGNYTFDPRTDRLVQLFPQGFWFETSVAVGVAVFGLAAATAWLAGRRIRSTAGAGSDEAMTGRRLEAVR